MIVLGLALGLALLLGLLAFVLTRSIRAHPGHPPPEETPAEGYRRELRSYLLGALFAAVLTGAAFALIEWPVLPGHGVDLALGALALLQIVAHLRFFLHIDPPRQKVDDLHLLLFSALILTMMAGGTIWILGDLASRMQ